MAARNWKDIWRSAFSPRYLLITNSLSCVTLLGMADVLQQMFMGASLTSSLPPHYYFEHYDYEHKKYKEKPKTLDEEEEIRRINWRRTVRVASIGFLTGPMNTFWYRWLERIIKGPITVPSIAGKVAADVAVSPLFDSTFIIGVALQEGKSIFESISEYKAKFWTIFMTSICVWSPTQTINFWLIPPQYRVLYVASITFFYNSLLTYIKHDTDEQYSTLRQYSSLRTLIYAHEDEEERIKRARALALPLPTAPNVIAPQPAVQAPSPDSMQITVLTNTPAPSNPMQITMQTNAPVPIIIADKVVLPVSSSTTTLPSQTSFTTNNTPTRISSLEMCTSTPPASEQPYFGARFRNSDDTSTNTTVEVVPSSEVAVNRRRSIWSDVSAYTSPPSAAHEKEKVVEKTNR